MTDKPTLEELKERIARETNHFGGVLPERVAIAWDGYLAALIEWGLISPADHKLLSGLLPEIVDNPVMAMLLGRD